ncbi:PASTA domain-containing protein [Streptomyces spiralis]|nr:PASTA domain-containing protein [Streptomyces spiralis]
MKNSDTDRTARGSRRKRVAAVAGVAAALLAIGGGTALAVGATGAATAKTTAATAATTTGSRNDATVQYGFLNGGSVPIRLAGLDGTMARALLVGKAGLEAQFVKVPCDGKPGSVVAVSPHAPTVVHKGDTVTVSLCTG